MTFEIGLLLALVACAMVLFATDWVPADVVALSLMVSLIVTGLLEPAEAFSGFGSDTFLLILGLLVLTTALLRTGVVDLAGRHMLRLTGDDPKRLTLVIMVSAAGLSAFMSNTAATAFFVPVVLGLARSSSVNPSKLLMPLAFSSIVTSSVTLVSTSTNIVVSGLMTKAGLPPMGMFELAPVGIPIAVLGIAYMMTIGRRLLPDREPAKDLLEEFGVRPYLSEVLLLPESPLAGKTLGESRLASDLDVTVVRIIRDKDRYLLPSPRTTLQAGDVLLVEASVDDLLKIKDAAGIEIKADFKLGEKDLDGKEATLMEFVLMPGSPLIGRTLKGFRFRERYGLQVLGINRHGESLRHKISQVPLRMGDVLVVQGDSEAIAALTEDPTFRPLGVVGEVRPLRKRAPVAIGIFVACLALSTFGVFPLAVAVLLGAIAVFATRCITPEEAYRALEWKVLVLIGSMLSLGVAMDSTGTAEYLAARILDLAGAAGPVALLAGFFVLTVALTQPMSNQAAAIVVLPVAMATAVQAGLNPRAFAMMVAVAASCSYLTPLEPSCLMVYGPGRYRFTDFLKVGAPLTLIILAASLLLVPMVWDLR